MTTYTSILKALCSAVSVSGTEAKYHSKLIPTLTPLFDRVETDRLGNLLCYKNCGKKDAPTLLVDTHFDQIGLMVTAQHEGGFLSVTAIGGLDTRILPATDVIIHGKRDLFGVVISTPPHLRKVEDKDKLCPVHELLIDCGIVSKAELEELAPLGTIISFATPLHELSHGRVTGPSLDNKACCAAAILAASQMKKEDMLFDLVLSLSACEEIGGRGAVTGTYHVNPDMAIVIDVNFAKAPGVDGKESIKMGGGPSVSLSVLTHRKLSKATLVLAKSKEIPCQTIVEVGNLGTNGNQIPLQLCAIPTVNMSLPLSSMHTAAEVVCEADGQALANLLCEMVANQDIFDIISPYKAVKGEVK